MNSSLVHLNQLKDRSDKFNYIQCRSCWKYFNIVDPESEKKMRDFSSWKQFFFFHLIKTNKHVNTDMINVQIHFQQFLISVLIFLFVFDLLAKKRSENRKESRMWINTKWADFAHQVPLPFQSTFALLRNHTNHHAHLYRTYTYIFHEKNRKSNSSSIILLSLYIVHTSTTHYFMILDKNDGIIQLLSHCRYIGDDKSIFKRFQPLHTIQ